MHFLKVSLQIFRHLADQLLVGIQGGFPQGGAEPHIKPGRQNQDGQQGDKGGAKGDDRLKASGAKGKGQRLFDLFPSDVRPLHIHPPFQPSFFLN